MFSLFHNCSNIRVKPYLCMDLHTGKAQGKQRDIIYMLFAEGYVHHWGLLTQPSSEIILEDHLFVHAYVYI